jgi:tetratricopeptide (TPR) repeat protein
VGSAIRRNLPGLVSQEAAEFEKARTPRYACYAHKVLGDNYTQKGLYKEALAEYQKWADLSPGGLECGVLFGYTYPRTGRTAEALKIVDQLRSEFRQGQPSVAASDVAQIYTALGDKDQALAWLETSIEKREEFPACMRVDPCLDPLHSDPRFQDLVRRMNFPD